MTELTPKAEALNDLVNNTIDHGIVSDHLTEDITDNVFRTIREELGITEEDAVVLAELGYDGYLTLLELAGINHGE